MLHAEDDRGHDHGRQGGLGDEGAEWHQEGEADNHQQPGVHPAESRPHAAGTVYRGPGKILCVKTRFLRTLVLVMERGSLEVL